MPSLHVHCFFQFCLKNFCHESQTNIVHSIIVSSGLRQGGLLVLKNLAIDQNVGTYLSYGLLQTTYPVQGYVGLDRCSRVVVG